MEISTADLVYINDAAKALKQKEILVINNKVIGLDLINHIFIYTTLDTNLYKCLPRPFAINSRELSAFIKTISLESSFTDNQGYINSMSGGELFIDYNIYNLQMQCLIQKHLNGINCMTFQDEEIPDMANKLKSMNKSDGGVLFNYNNYLMTLSPSIIPMNKADKLFINILDCGKTFVSRFRVNKKKSDVFIYVRFYKL